jgi:predicted small lipoprotein YifL
MRMFATLAMLLVLAGCGGGPPALPTDQVRASFPPGGVVDQIQVDAVDRLPLRSAELVAPDGSATRAASIIANPAPTETFSQQFPNGPYSSGQFGVSSIGSNALAPAVVGAAPQTQTTLLAVVSSASIPLPDPVAYRRDWQKYRIRLRFGDPPGPAGTREIAAPEPPPGG